MLRYEDIDEISDGRLYEADDMVAADTHGCKGCSKCCESDMGSTIVLTPYDMYNLEKATGKSFDELLTSFHIELSMIDNIILPNLKMDSGCKFLVEGRCEIHKLRPGICRLFPLGRIYKDKGFKYFLQVQECAVEDRGQVSVRDWIDIEDLDKNSAFINKWHKFIQFEQKKVNELRQMAENEAARIEDITNQDLKVYAEIVGDLEWYEEKGSVIYRKEKAADFRNTGEADVGEVMKKVLGYFYLDSYNIEEDFYEQFDERLKKCLGALRK